MDSAQQLGGTDTGTTAFAAGKPALVRRVEYSRLVADHEGSALRCARRLCVGNEDRAQDLVQEAVVRGYQAFLEGRFIAGSNARAWLLRIVTNLFLNEQSRSNKWDAGVDVDSLTAEGAAVPSALRSSAADVPEARVMARILDEPLERALAQLPPDYRACIILVDIEDMDYETAATMLGIKPGALRTRLSRARMRLHSLLYSYAQDRRLI